jgi:hypothetical protein
VPRLDRPHYTFEPFGATVVSGAMSTNVAQFTGRENDGTGRRLCLGSDMRLILLSFAAILMGSFLVVYGALLASRPDVFLRFHDTFVDRSKWNRNAAWRRNVYNGDYKVLGVAFFVFGVFIVLVTLTMLISNQH